MIALYYEVDLLIYMLSKRDVLPEIPEAKMERVTRSGFELPERLPLESLLLYPLFVLGVSRGGLPPLAT